MFIVRTVSEDNPAVSGSTSVLASLAQGQYVAEAEDAQKKRACNLFGEIGGHVQVPELFNLLMWCGSEMLSQFLISFISILSPSRSLTS